MQYRPGKASDFDHLETFVWQAIFPAFDVAGLTEDERAENDALVAGAKATVLSALTDVESAVITAWDERRRAVAGYCLLETSRRQGRVLQLVVRRADWGKGIGTELLRAALEKIGPYRDIILQVRYYNHRAISFFERHGFVNSGESVPGYAIDRLLLVKPATEQAPVVEATEAGESESVTYAEDFPSEADAPPEVPQYEPVFEELPDYTLAYDNEPTNPGESFLDTRQQSELNAFIAKARAAKAAKKKPNIENRHPEVLFEVDYGEPEGVAEPESPKGSGLGFEFAFDPAPASPPPPAEPEETLELKDIPEVTEALKTAAPVTTADLRAALEDRLGERLTNYFGTERLTQYLHRYGRDENFHRIRDVALQSLAIWLNLHADDNKERTRRQEDVLADLIEYFIVESGAELHEGVYAQRLLRYQGVDWREVDLFKLVMDYLDFDTEEEVVYTDFVTMPARTLRNATESYLRAGRDERVFFICDQSLLGGGKHGFAVTDSGMYWKNVLQPAGLLNYRTLNQVSVEAGHLTIDHQYFDAGARLNLRVVLLLDKLRRMHTN